MANPEHEEILKKGPDHWNQWRKENPEIKPNLRGADLSGADLSDADLTGADLYGANLYEANLPWANLSKANLNEANLSWADLYETNFLNLYISNTIFADVDLSQVEGLETCIHGGPSTVDHRTLIRSGKLPDVFLRGCGFPDSFIEHLPGLIGSLDPIQFYSCFISYSTKDDEFAHRLHADLQAKGIRCWFAPEDLKIGEEFRTRIDEVIRIHDKLLLILSESSVNSSG